jgi:hypothetical protein
VQTCHFQGGARLRANLLPVGIRFAVEEAAPCSLHNGAMVTAESALSLDRHRPLLFQRDALPQASVIVPGRQVPSARQGGRRACAFAFASVKSQMPLRQSAIALSSEVCRQLIRRPPPMQIILSRHEALRLVALLENLIVMERELDETRIIVGNWPITDYILRKKHSAVHEAVGIGNDR